MDQRGQIPDFLHEGLQAKASQFLSIHAVSYNLFKKYLKMERKSTNSQILLKCNGLQNMAIVDSHPLHHSQQIWLLFYESFHQSCNYLPNLI